MVSVIICIYLSRNQPFKRTSDGRFRDQGNLRHHTSKLIKWDLVYLLNTFWDSFLRIFTAERHFLFQVWKKNCCKTASFISIFPIIYISTITLYRYPFLIFRPVISKQPAISLNRQGTLDKALEILPDLQFRTSFVGSFIDKTLISMLSGFI